MIFFRAASVFILCFTVLYASATQTPYSLTTLSDFVSLQSSSYSPHTHSAALEFISPFLHDLNSTNNELALIQYLPGYSAFTENLIMALGQIDSQRIDYVSGLLSYVDFKRRFTALTLEWTTLKASLQTAVETYTESSQLITTFKQDLSRVLALQRGNLKQSAKHSLHRFYTKEYIKIIKYTLDVLTLIPVFFSLALRHAVDVDMLLFEIVVPLKWLAIGLYEVKLLKSWAEVVVFGEQFENYVKRWEALVDEITGKKMHEDELLA